MRFILFLKVALLAFVTDGISQVDNQVRAEVRIVRFLSVSQNFTERNVMLLLRYIARQKVHNFAFLVQKRFINQVT